MTASTELGASTEGEGGPFGAGWRAERARMQEAAIEGSSAVLSCSAPYGAGGLGRHLGELHGALRRVGATVECLCGGGAEGHSCRELVPDRLASSLGRLVRRSPAWRMRAASVAFDIAATRAMLPAERLIAFSGQSLRQQRAARAEGFAELSLVSPTSHLRQVQARYEQAHRSHPIEHPWSTRLLERSVAEYEAADRIYVSSRHVWESFLAEGVAEEKLACFPLTPDPRFDTTRRESRDSFDIVYVGSLSVVKGVPLLLDAVRRVPASDLRLLLVGGWESRGMRRHIQRACAEDARIEVHLGDPLTHLKGASLYVHPSYEDGFSYSSAEAMACGVPVLVSDATGMKELIEPGRTGTILPTGDADALAGAIQAAYRGELFGG